MRRVAGIAVGAALGVAVAFGALSCATGGRAAGGETPATSTGEVAVDATSEPAETIAANATPSANTTPAPSATPSTQAVTEPAPTAPPPPEWVALSPKVRVARAAGLVEFDAVAVLVEGFLEQFVCTASTREHESLFVFEGKASEIHAALLVAGLVPGAPGGWREPADDAEAIEAGFVALAPHGPEVSVEVVLADGSRHGIASFARLSPVAFDSDADDGRAPPAPPSRFVFAGSRFRARADGGERYLADDSGSLVGLVTFGDETIAALEVIPDQASVAAPVFEGDPSRMPAPGSRVVIRIGAVPAKRTTR